MQCIAGEFSLKRLDVLLEPLSKLPSGALLRLMALFFVGVLAQILSDLRIEHRLV